MNAIVEINGKQYKVSKDQEILVDKFKEDSKKIRINKILMVWDDKKTSFGDPYLKNSYIEVEILGEKSGAKITILKHKAKKRYRRKIGAKPVFSRIKIIKIKL